eukprot:NODE_41_length_29768_cov_0.533924.p10 type:complete len:291 gc:universal NODE_41_length_29768_cov_0.533924:12506-11634(-)
MQVQYDNPFESINQSELSENNNNESHSSSEEISDLDLEISLHSDDISIEEDNLESQVSEMEVGRAVMEQQKLYNTLLSDRIKLQKKMQHFNNLEDMPVIEFQESDLQSQLQSYYSLLNKCEFKSTDDLDSLYNKLLDESQQDTKLKGMQPVSEQIVNILDKDMERLVKKTKLNRISKTEHESNFDDCDFYSILLKEYLETKSDSPDAQAQIKKFKQSIKIHTREVDHKGSKAKTLNTTKVHEKIKGFVPCIKRYKGLWEEENIDMLISSLFGQSVNVEDPTQDIGNFNIF